MIPVVFIWRIWNFSRFFLKTFDVAEFCLAIRFSTEFIVCSGKFGAIQLWQVYLNRSFLSTVFFMCFTVVCRLYTLYICFSTYTVVQITGLVKRTGNCWNLKALKFLKNLHRFVETLEVLICAPRHEHPLQWCRNAVTFRYNYVILASGTSVSYG